MSIISYRKVGRAWAQDNRKKTSTNKNAIVEGIDIREVNIAINFMKDHISKCTDFQGLKDRSNNYS